MDSGAWTLNNITTALTNDSHNQEVGRRWLEQGEGEHSSVASFARHTLQLMSIGASAELLIASQQAAVDEVRHSKICYGLASSFLGCNYEPGTLDIEASLEKLGLMKIAKSLIKEGCIGETMSAVEARLGAHTAQDPLIKSLLTQIAKDETNHAQLAWDTIYWINKRFSEIDSFVGETFHYELENIPLVVETNDFIKDHPACLECKVDSVLKNYGLVVENEKEKIRRATIKSIIEPVYFAKLKKVDLISTKIKHFELDKY